MSKEEIAELAMAWYNAGFQTGRRQARLEQQQDADGCDDDDAADVELQNMRQSRTSVWSREHSN